MRIAPPTPEAGTYPTGVAGLTRNWDGHAWAWHPQADPSAEALPKWHHRPWAVFVHPSFWLWIGSAAISAGLAYLYRSTHTTAFIWAAAIIGCVGAAAALVIFLNRRLQFSRVVSWPEFLMWGILGGAISVVVSYFGEGLFPGLGGDASAGPFEESTKILIPVVLFLIGWYRDPRAGFAIAVSCGVVFGIAEGIEYIAVHPDMVLTQTRVHHPGDGSDAESKTAMIVAWAAYRPTVELLHPLLVGFTAAIAWRWAAARGRFWIPLLVALLIAAALHSFIDVTDSLSGYWVAASMVVVVLLYFVLTKPAARELPGPDTIRDNPPTWRPRIARHLRKEATQPAPTPAATP